MLFQPLRSELSRLHDARSVSGLSLRATFPPGIVNPQLRKYLPASGIDPAEDARFDRLHRLLHPTSPPFFVNGRRNLTIVLGLGRQDTASALPGSIASKSRRHLEPT